MDEQADILAHWPRDTPLSQAGVQLEQNWDAEGYPTSVWHLLTESDSRATRAIVAACRALCQSGVWRQDRVEMLVLAQRGWSGATGRRFSRRPFSDAVRRDTGRDVGRDVGCERGLT